MNKDQYIKLLQERLKEMAMENKHLREKIVSLNKIIADYWCEDADILEIGEENVKNRKR